MFFFNNTILNMLILLHIFYSQCHLIHGENRRCQSCSSEPPSHEHTLHVFVMIMPFFPNFTNDKLPQLLRSSCAVLSWLQLCLMTVRDLMTIACQAPLSMWILQARILEWVTLPSSRRSSKLKDLDHFSFVSCTGRWVLYH